MDIERVRTYAEFTNLEPVWNDLLTKAATNSVFLTHEWASSWWTACAGKRELSILVLKDGEAVRAIAPLMITDYTIFRRLGFIGSNRSDYCDFIVDRDHLAGYEALLTYLCYDFVDWDEIMLENIPETSPLLTAVEKNSSRLIIKKKVLDVCPYMKINDDPKKLLRRIEKSQSLRRKINRLQRIGNLTFRHYTEQTEMEKELRNLLEGYLLRFDEGNMKDRLPLELAFHMQLLQRMDPKDMIRFGVLELEGRTIARHFGFAYNGVYHWVRPAFDPSYSEYSPGVIMLYYLVDYAVKNGFREFDFLRGKEPFKTNIADHVRQVMIVKLYRSFPKSILCKAAATLNSLLQRRAFRQT
jgi:CelD/BcsL family acetyltransferase involved in cellulose biosynthesis